MASAVSQHVSADVEQVVRDAVRTLSELRPPSDFVLRSDGIVMQTSNDANADAPSFTSAIADTVELESLSLEPRLSFGPPIFDGAIANSTPNVGTSVGGGVGTALHAVAALDHPLSLALLLVMGADVRACHTAFRRYVQHEAACNGSIQCLSLLLELGKKFAAELSIRSDSASFQRSPSNEKLPATRSPNSTLDFPCLQRRGANSALSTLTSLHSKPLQLLKKTEKTSDLLLVESQVDTLSLLRLFVSLVKQVSSGTLTELDAARSLLNHAKLSEQTKSALAIQSGFVVPLDTGFTSNIQSNRRSSVNINSSDGHGNTPLHWAAFKNESSCVSLLLKYQVETNARAYPSGWTPLHDAAYSNGHEVIALLIDAGALVDARASSGATPLCFAAQEDAAEAAGLLLRSGADLCIRCAPEPVSTQDVNANETPARPSTQTRFSGYTPLHYCAHYNASKAAKVLLQHPSAVFAMEIRDFNDRLPIHVAVARGSSDVLRELLKAGARVETRSLNRHHSCFSASPTRRSNRRTQSSSRSAVVSDGVRSAPSTPMRLNNNGSAEATESLTSPNSPVASSRNQSRGRTHSTASSTSVSSPILRSMIPSQPVQSSKPWNCLTQRSIDECRQLISEVEQNWTPDRHSLFTPADRRAVAELLRVGKRLEAEGSLLFIDLWPEVLSFCGRGWFEMEGHDDTEATDMDFLDDTTGTESSDHDLSLPTFR